MKDERSVAQRDEADSSSSGRPEAPAYTKGPWRVLSTSHSPVFLVVCGDDTTDINSARGVAFVERWPHELPVSESEANARLIAAAPELLEAAQRAFDAISNPALEYDPYLDDALCVLEDAISKATGKTP